MSVSPSLMPPVSPSAPWRLQDLALGFGLAALGFLVLIGVLTGAAVGLDLDPDRDSSGALLAAAISFCFEAWLGVTVWLLARRRGVTGEDLGLDRPRSWRWTSYAVLASYGVLIGYTGIVSLIERATGVDLGMLKQGNGIPESPANTSLVWFVLGLSVVVVAPLAEELFFRAFVFRAAEARFGFVAAALVSGVAFAAFHVNVGVAIPFFGIGVIFAWAYHASRSLWTSVAAHVIFNTIAFVATLAGVAS